MRPAARCDKLSRMNRRTFLSSVAALPMLSSLQPPQAPPSCPAPRRTEARDCHLQHREGLGHPDDHQEPDRGRLRRRRAADDAQARRGDYPAGGGARGRPEAVRGVARQDRRARHDLRVPLAGSGASCARTSTRRRSGSSWRRTSGRRASRSGPNGLPQGRARGEDARADRQGARRVRRVRARPRHR